VFEVTQHELGTIAAGAKAEFAFKFTNKYLYGVHVARVRSSCGCSDVRVTKDSLATYERGEVLASINSQRLRGDQSSTLTVVFDKPRYAEVQLMIQGSVRSLVSVAPASLYLGSLRPGQSVSKRLVVRAAKPFHIQEISTDCGCFEFTYASDEAKALHLVPVKFTARDTAGAVKRTIRVKTDLNGTEAEVVALAAVDEQAK